MATKAQVQTHKEIIKSGKKGKDSIRILIKLDSSIGTIESLAKDLNLKENTVSGRISDLMKEGLVRVEGQTKNSNGTTVSIFKKTAPGEEEHYSITYRTKRKLALLKNLKDNYSDLLTDQQRQALGFE